MGRNRGWWLRSLGYLAGIVAWLPGDWPFRDGTAYLVLLHLVVIGSAIGVLLRDTYPRALWGVGMAAALAGTTGPLAIGLLVVAMRRRTSEALAAAAGGALMVVVANGGPNVAALTHGRVRTGTELTTFVVGTIILAVVLPTLIGSILHSREARISALQHQVAAAEAERRRAEADAVYREQQRIAGEMHDSLGHKLILIAMRAQALEARALRGDCDIVEAAAEASVIHGSARAALADLRDVIGALGAESSTAPHRGLAEISGLVEQSRHAGSAVTLVDELTGRPEARELPEVTARAVHRIVQEALTNAHKHAPGLPILVRLAGAPEQGVRVSVENPLPESGESTHGSQVGLAGVAARVRLLGGSFDARPDEGSFLLCAELPWPARPPGTQQVVISADP